MRGELAGNLQFGLNVAIAQPEAGRADPARTEPTSMRGDREYLPGSRAFLEGEWIRRLARDQDDDGSVVEDREFRVVNPAIAWTLRPVLTCVAQRSLALGWAPVAPPRERG